MGVAKAPNWSIFKLEKRESRQLSGNPNWTIPPPHPTPPLWKQRQCRKHREITAKTLLLLPCFWATHPLFYYFMCLGVLPAFLCVHPCVCLVPEEDRRGSQTRLALKSQTMWAAMWVLEIERWSPGRIASVLNHGGISPGSLVQVCKTSPEFMIYKCGTTSKVVMVHGFADITV